MNVKMIRYIISKMMGVEGLLMLLPMMVGIIYGEHTSVYFLITAAILTAIYLLFGFIGYNYLGVREYPSVDNPIISVSCSVERGRRQAGASFFGNPVCPKR